MSGLENHRIVERRPWKIRFNYAWANFFKLPEHTSPANFAGHKNSNDFIWKFFEDAEWHRIYDFIEFLLVSSHGKLAPEINEVLEREVAGYRVLNGIISPISDSTLIDAINSGIESSRGDSLHGAYDHLVTSLRFLSNREQPDYRNSIKESISAVESAVSAITGRNTPNINDALAVLGERGSLHPALKSAFSKLYGWTSDEDGIRHALMQQSSLGFEDAQFMLVACSAFVHYMVAKASDESE